MVIKTTCFICQSDSTGIKALGLLCHQPPFLSHQPPNITYRPLSTEHKARKVPEHASCCLRTKNNQNQNREHLIFSRRPVVSLVACPNWLGQWGHAEWPTGYWQEWLPVVLRTVMDVKDQAQIDSLQGKHLTYYIIFPVPRIFGPHWAVLRVYSGL